MFVLQVSLVAASEDILKKDARRLHLRVMGLTRQEVG